jgi:predicted dehydrogenase
MLRSDPVVVNHKKMGDGSEHKTTMQLPTAAEFHADRAMLFQLSDATIGLQPDSTPLFHFGLQPQAVKDIDSQGKRRIIGIIGAGDVYKKFVRHALDHRGTERYIADLNPDIDNPEKGGGFKFNALEHRAMNVERLLAEHPDLDYVMVLTSPDSHFDYIRAVTRRSIPVMVEKPIVPAGFYLTHPGGLEKRLKYSDKAPKVPIYAMDWEVLLATPLMAALGINSPFHDIVEFGHDGKDREAFKQEFDLNSVTRVEATLLEGGTNELGNISKVKRDRPWMFNIMSGGGILYDMAVHPLNALAVMGFMPGNVKHATLGEAPDPERDRELGRANLAPGTYYKIGDNDDTVEFYALAELDTQFRGKTIPSLIEAGKAGAASDMRIKLIDNHNHVIDWQYGPDKSEVMLKDQGGKILATACSHVDPYALIIEQATRFFEHEKAAKAVKKEAGFRYTNPTALYYHEHQAVLYALDQIHEVGRAQAVQDHETVHQLQLGQSADLVGI